MPNRVHSFVESDPRRAVAGIVDRFEGRFSRVLRDAFPSRRSRLPTGCSRPYFAATVGAVYEGTIRRCIASPKGK